MNKPDTVYVVEDNPTMSQLLAERLPSYCQTVKKFASAEAALDDFHNGCQPDIIILDLKLGKMDGLSLIEIMRAENFRGAVILASGFSDKKAVTVALRLGIIEVLEKPFQLDQFIAAVDRAHDFVQLRRTEAKIEEITSDLVQNCQSLISAYETRVVNSENLLYDHNIPYPPADVKVELVRHMMDAPMLHQLIVESEKQLQDLKQYKVELEKRIVMSTPQREASMTMSPPQLQLNLEKGRN